MSDDELSKNIVSIGSTVTIKYADGKEITYDIVGSNEVAPLERKISDLSPIGKAVIGHKSGDSVTIVTPTGEKDATIVKFAKTKK